jgi:hypothetical protein
MIGEAVEVCRDEGIAPAHPGQPVDAKPGYFEKRDLFHFTGFGDVVYRETAAEVFALGDAVGQVVLEIAALVAIGLHGHDVGAVGDKKQVVRCLQMMRPRVLPGREKIRRSQIAGIAGIQDGDAVAEHVTDIQVIAARHDLNAVRAPANIAV